MKQRHARHKHSTWKAYRRKARSARNAVYERIPLQSSSMRMSRIHLFTAEEKAQRLAALPSLTRFK